MRETTMKANGRELPVLVLDTAVVGTGCAGLNAADRLWHYGRRDIALVTDHVKGGTSRNTGSDKQTYYKLTLSGSQPDSVAQMAQTFFQGQCVDGEHALCEAALSVPCFLRLCDLGVPFPTNRYGEYVGYKTDHDPGRRATSVGPLTSRRMTEALERAVNEKGIPILDRHQVIAVLTHENRVKGLLCLRTGQQAGEENGDYRVILCNQVIYATGGPAGIYRDSCYPLGHYGMSGALFEAGARGKNLTEWQYGLASVKPRWNVSGTYMQALPRFFSTDPEGGDPREFLPDYLPDPGALLSNVFLKGYQWPFDTRKAMGGSSVIDLIVYTETRQKGRRVFLDYRENPLGDRLDLQLLSPEAREYLSRAGALFGKPIDRLRHMNAPAVAFYREKGVDLEREPLEIALCSQHNNGGISVDGWWQSHVEGLFVCGEAAASHGVYRPGGSALNAGQVGSERAARYISAQPERPVDEKEALAAVSGRIGEMMAVGDRALGGESDLEDEYRQAVAKMSRSGAAVRDRQEIAALRNEVREKLDGFAQTVRIREKKELPLLYRYRDILLSQYAYLTAMEDYALRGGKSRGSALYTDAAGEKPLPGLPEFCRFTPDDGALGGRVQEVALDKHGAACLWRDVRPIPEEDDFFENVWRAYRQNGNVY